MPPEDFTPSPKLAAGLERSADDGRPLYELVVPRRPIVDDLSLVPDDATFVATRGTARHLTRLRTLERLEALWANPATPALFEACAQAPALRALYVTHFKRLDTVAIAGAPRLEHLMLGWAPRLADLSFLRDLPSLRTIYLEDMKRVDLTTLPELPEVTGLHLGGTMWTALDVESLEPLTRLPGLRHLRLVNVRPRDGRLRPLARLRALREVHLPNFFELEEVARLAGALPAPAGDALSPVFLARRDDSPPSSPYLCPTCGGSRDMMTGKPTAFLCPSCDAAKYRRRVTRWEIARASGWPADADQR